MSTTTCATNQDKTDLHHEAAVLSEETLDRVVGGLNPQPLPPRDPNPDELKLTGDPIGPWLAW
jgi:hypothetical protein